MPIMAGLLAILDAYCAWYIYSTGRPKWWFAVVFAFPGIGAAAYILFEIVPGTRGGVQVQREINKTMDGIARAMDPEKELRRRIAELEINPSIDNKLVLEGPYAASAAEAAYAEAVEIFSGEEARSRYGMMLTVQGQTERARLIFEALLKNAERLPPYYRDAQAEWIKGAKRELAVVRG